MTLHPPTTGSTARPLVTGRRPIACPRLTFGHLEGNHVLVQDKAIGSNYQVSPKDLVNTKKALNQLGYYNVPEHRGIDDWTDDATFDGIRAFQKDNKLKIDGFMRPGGPTETAINQSLASSGAPGEEPPGGAMYQCSRCGAWHGGVYSPSVCYNCWNKGLR